MTTAAIHALLFLDGDGVGVDVGDAIIVAGMDVPVSRNFIKVLEISVSVGKKR